MKRLKLDDFKSKNLKKEDAKQVDQLLGQVLGNCHDSKGTSSTGRKRPGRASFGDITLKK